MGLKLNYNNPLFFLVAGLEPVSIKGYNLACVRIEDLDQTAHMRSLIRVFDRRSIGSQGYNVSPGGNYDCDLTVRMPRLI